MQIGRSWLATGLIFLIVAGGGWLAWDLRPSHQLEKQFRHLLDAAEQRNWVKAKEYVADDYHDSWSMDRETMLRAAQTVCGQFIALGLTPEEMKISLNGPEGIITCRLRLTGQGTALAQEAMQQANALQSDFQFAWSRKSWKPWDWKLHSVRQNEIQFDPSWLQ